jgi:WD40 repeat protein
MSYCLNPYCSESGKSSPANQPHDLFCVRCGAPLTLGDRYRATHLMHHYLGGRTLAGIDEHRPSKPPCLIQQLQKPSEESSEENPFQSVAERLEVLGQHPHIPALWASFEQGQYRYLVQESLSGVSLSAQLKKHGAFPERKIRTILHYILPILDFAHHHHVVHGNISSETMVYVKRETPSAVKGMLTLVGFGTALLTPAPPATEALPENRWHADPTLHKTIQGDLYQLGMTCIQLLTNKPLAALYDENQQTWQWESHAKSDVSGLLCYILNKLLHPSSDGYQGAQEVLDEVNQTSSGVSYRQTFVPQAKNPVAGASSVNEAIAPPRQTTASSTWHCVKTLRGHEAWVRSIALSADGRLLASGSGDKTVKLWSVDTGQLLHTLKGHSTWVRDVAISPDQRFIASVSNDKTIRLWRTQTGEPIQTLTGHGDWIRSVVFLPSDGLIATAGQDKVIHIWDLRRNQIIRTLEGHEHWVLCLVPHPNGKHLFSGSRDRTIRCWDMTTGVCEDTLSGHSSEVTALAMTSRGDRLLSCSGDQTIAVWDVNTRQRLQTLHSHTAAVNGVAIHPSEAEFASGSTDKTIKLWRFDDDSPYATLSGHTGWVWTVAFSRQPTQSTVLASGSWDGTINLWQP